MDFLLGPADLRGIHDLFRMAYATRGSLVILGLLMIQILPPPIFMVLDRQFPHPFHDVPLDFGPMGIALIFLLLFRLHPCCSREHHCDNFGFHSRQAHATSGPGR